MEKIKLAVATTIGGFFSFFGLLALPLIILVVSNILDWITGCVASNIKGEAISSNKSYKGIFKKVSMYILIMIGFMFDLLLEYGITQMGWDIQMQGFIAVVIAMWLVLNEMISIVENISVIGIDIPFLRPLMNLVKDKVEEPFEKFNNVDKDQE